MVRRSRPVVDELDAEFADSDGPSETALLVAHGGLIAGLVTGLMELPTSAWPSFGGLGNCRWAVLARRADHPRWRLAGYNVGARPDRRSGHVPSAGPRHTVCASCPSPS